MEEGWLRSSLVLVGGVTVLYWVLGFILDIARLFRCYVWARLVKGEPWNTRFGQWAVVTGASDGIGKAYVHKLAARGMNVVLIARNKDKLDRVAQYVRSEYGIETSVVIADFADGQSIYGNIAKELEGKDIGVLVNNVGVCGSIHELFCNCEEKDFWDMVNVNIANVPAVTKIVLPGMLQRKRGVIINISSISSVWPWPTLAMYSASKAFVDFFSAALSTECEGTGVMIQSVCPGPVHSNITKPLNDHTVIGDLPSFTFPTADMFVESALATVGHTDYTHGYWSHSLWRFMMTILMALPFNTGNKYVLKIGMKTREDLNKILKVD